MVTSAATPKAEEIRMGANVHVLERPAAKTPPQTKMATDELTVFYGDKPALMDVNLEIPANHVTALIGPSGCGKSTFIRCMNRMNDLIPVFRLEGKIEYDGMDIYSEEIRS